MLASNRGDLNFKEITIMTPSLTVNGIGERLTSWTASGTVGGYIQPVAAELTDRFGASTGLVTDVAYTKPADIRMGYRLALGGQVWEVLVIRAFTTHLELDLRKAVE